MPAKTPIMQNNIANLQINFVLLLNHSYEYGFVLRYPADKTIITGHEFNPTIFRYVGVEVATAMHQQNLCLEEYNNLNVNE